MSNIQINLRCPVTAKDAVQETCQRLRNDPRFEERLRTFLANEGAQQDQDVREKVDQLANDVWHLYAMLGVTNAGQTRIKHQIERGVPDRQIAADCGVPVEVVAYLRRSTGRDAPEASTAATETATQPLETGDRTDLLETADSGHTGAADRPWTVGTGQGKALTADGVAEVERRLREGQGPKAIARVVGVSSNTVQYRKKKLREQGLVP